jgi:type IV pilus assembly protein PilW
MNKPTHYFPRVSPMSTSHQFGLSLADWLVGQALAAMVVLAAMSTWGFAQQNHTLTQEGLQQVQQMSWVWRILGQHIRQAGASQAIQSADGQIALSNSMPIWSAVDGAGTLADSLTTAHLRSLEGRDCQGNSKGGSSTIRNRFTVNTKSELTCLDEANPSASAQALAEGIEDMQLRYAQSTQGGNGLTQLQWVTAQAGMVSSQVLAVEVCIRRKGTPISKAMPTAMKGCRGESLPSDGRVRWVQRQVFAWRQVDNPAP